MELLLWNFGIIFILELWNYYGIFLITICPHSGVVLVVKGLTLLAADVEYRFWKNYVYLYLIIINRDGCLNCCVKRQVVLSLYAAILSDYDSVPGKIMNVFY